MFDGLAKNSEDINIKQKSRGKLMKLNQKVPREVSKLIDCSL